MSPDPRVDAFIAKSGAFARPVLTRFRALVHACEAEAVETIKWGMPHFTVEGKILAGMAAFKAHCALIIEDAGDRQGMDGGGMGHFGKIRSEAEMPDAAVLEKLIMARAVRIRAGDRKPAKAQTQKPEPVMPEDFAASLSDPARTFFDSLAPSQRRDYVDWITGAKRPDTRARRIAEAAQWLAEGKKRHWKYENC